MKRLTKGEKELREQARRLQASKERYRTLFEGANDAILIMNGDRFTDCNAMSLAMFGCDRREEIIGRSPWDLSPLLQADGTPSKARGLEIIRRAMEGEPQRFQWQHVRGDGTLFDAEVSLNRLRAGDEMLLQALVRDVTERNRMEDRLRNSEEYYRTLIETSPEAIVIVDMTGKLAFASRKAYDLFRVPQDRSIAGRSMFDWVLPADYATVESRWREALANKTEPYTQEYRLLREDRTIIWCEVASSPLFDTRRQVNGLLVVCHDISARKAADNALRESEERFSRLADASFEGIVVSKRGKVIDANDQIAAMLRCPRPTLLGMEVLKFVAPSSIDIVTRHIREGSEEPYEHMALRSDGTTFPVEVRAKSIPSNRDNVRVTAIRDITERKQAEEALRSSELQYRSLFENANDAIFIFDPWTEVVLEANPMACELYGFPRDQFVGRSLRDSTLNASWGRDIIDRTLDTGLLKNFEYAYATHAGSTIHFLVNASVIDYRGSKAILSISRDLTYRKTSADRLSFLSAAVDQSPASIVLTDVSGAIEYVNPRFSSLTGYSPEEVIGKNPSILKSGEKPSREYRQLWSTILAGGEWHGEFHNRKKDGTLYWESATISPVITNGTITHFLAIKEDITSRKEMEERLRQMQKMESIGILAGGIAHDFNNILTIILGHISLVDMRKQEPALIGRSLSAMSEAVRRGASLVNQILTFARKSEVILEPVSVNRAIGDLVKMLEETFPKTIEIQLDLEPAIPMIMMDHTQLHQALLNLCVNARDAIAESSVGQTVAGTLRISTRLTEGARLQATANEAVAAHYVCVSVRDTGAGMDDETKRRVFEPFFTTKEAGKGTGLGLSVVYGVVKSHHGLIDVQSSPGVGTTFTLCLPVPEIFASPSESSAEIPATVRGGNETILIVEDESAIAGLMEKIFTEQGYKVLTAHDGVDGLEIYTTRMDEISLVLTDMGLPKLDGGSLFVRLREMNPDARVIIASGYLEPAQRDALTRAGAKAIISKPYMLNEILRVVRDVLDGSV